uniref:NR LBD domain-containing protein n=1 Tax=Parascaris univalens TaxID=6257 RepID=A0A915A7J4_PARUN
MSFQSSSDYSKEEVLCSKVFSPASFSDDADERANEAAENTSRVGVLGGNLKNATLSQKRKAINRVCPQVCTVCSGPANGYHYDAPSCNGCKAFFRRSFVSGKRYECKKDRKCNLTDGRRTSCRACRYNKCVEVGMKTQLMQLSNVAICSRSSHAQTSKNTKFHEAPLAMQSTTAKLLWFDESEFAAVIGALVYNETQCDFLRRSTFDPIGTRLTLADLISAPSELRNLRAYQLIRQWPVKQPPPMDYHGQRRCPRLHTFKFWILCDLVLLLSRNAAVANCSLMQSYYSYKSKSNKVMFPDGIFPILFTKRPPPMESILSYGGVEPLIRSMIDECEYVLLKAIIFTHYSYEGLSAQGRTLLERERQKFARILFNYTGARYGATVGSCRFAELLALVGTFFHLADKHRQFHTLLSIAMHPRKHRSTLMEEMLA